MAVRPFRASALRRMALVGLAIAGLAGCTGSDAPKAFKPVPFALVSAMEKLDMKETSQVFIRIFKETSELEVWKEQRNGNFALLKTYQICKWSGALGPKKKEGDRQAPEGFYIVTPAQMNPKSSYYLSFNIGYPNAYDRSWERTGSNLMVHGACSSAGCYSMTDEDAGELFALARDSFRGGQTNFQIQALPFRMSPQNLARHRDDPNMDFWKMLKVGSDHFDLTHRPPKIDVCDRHYVFNADAGGGSFSASAPCPAYSVPETLTAALKQKQAEDEAATVAAMATMEAAARTEAEAKQVAAAEAAAKAAAEEQQAAAEEQQAAERTERPSLVSRVISRFTGRNASEEKDAALDPVPVAAIASVPDKPVPKVIASVPVPRVRPSVAIPADAAPPTTFTAEAPVTSPEKTGATTAVITPEMTPVSPPVGTFVKKKFLWPGDEPAPATTTPPG